MTVTAPNLPVAPQVLTIDPVHQVRFQEIKASGKDTSGNPMSYSSSWGYTVPSYYPRGNWNVKVRWFWNDKRIPDIDDWLRDGNDGKWGIYRAEVWDTPVYWTYRFPERNRAPWEVGWFQVEVPKYCSSISFPIAVRGKEPLPPGTPPIITEQPEQATNIVADGSWGITLKMVANAGEGFQYRWLEEGREDWSHPFPTLSLSPNQCTDQGKTYVGEAYNDKGTARTREIFVRRAHRARVSTVGMPTLVRSGQEVLMTPAIESDSSYTCEWTGPALTSSPERVTVTEEGVLTIADTALADGGVYTLKVTNAEAVVVRTVELTVVELAATEVPLREGGVLEVLSAGAPLKVTDYCYWRNAGSSASGAVPTAEMHRATGNRWVLKKVKPEMSGEYECVVRVESKLTRERPADGWTPYAHASTDFVTASLTLGTVSVNPPSLKAMLPDVALPVGQVAAVYHFELPLPGTRAAAGTRFSARGLPRGLSLSSITGAISGIPQVSGTFKVSMTASNSNGTSAPVVYLLTIAPLPEGAVGNFLLYATDKGDNSQYRLSLTISSSGAFTLKGGDKPLTGKVEIDASGRITLKTPHEGEFEIAPDTHLISGRMYVDWKSRTFAGWRQTWSAKRPAVPYSGRYHFATEVPAAAEGTAYGRQGRFHGSCVITPTGQTVVTFYQVGQAPTLTSAFLGPQGQVLLIAEWWDLFATALVVDGGTGLLSGSAMVKWSLKPLRHRGADGWQFDSDHPPVQMTFSGGRYLPPPPGAILPNFTAGNRNALLVVGFELTPGVVEFPATLTAKDQVILPKPTPETWSATCRLNRTTGEITGTIKLPVITISNHGVRASRLTTVPYHLFLVPTLEGGFRMEGYLSLRTRPDRQVFFDHGGAFDHVPVRLEPVE